MRFAALMLSLLVSPAAAETYQLRTKTASSDGIASAVCVGKSQQHALFLTAGHVANNGAVLSLHDGDRWHAVSQLVIDAEMDVASFRTAQPRKWRLTRLMSGVPDETTVKVCGYFPGAGNRCFGGVLTGNRVAAGRRHVRPGDSGGGVVLQVGGHEYLAGLIQAYGQQDGQTYVVPTLQLSRHLQRYYQRPPQCYRWGDCQPGRRYERVEPQLFGSPRVERYEEILPEPSDAPLFDSSDLDRQLQQISERLRQIEAQTRRVIIRRGGKTLDDRQLLPDDALILDVDRITQE